jgi:hypothetical protein
MDYWILNPFLAFESGTIQSMFKTIISSIAMSSAFSQSLKGLKSPSILVLLLLIYKTIFYDFLGKVDEGSKPRWGLLPSYCFYRYLFIQR